MSSTPSRSAAAAWVTPLRSWAGSDFFVLVLSAVYFLILTPLAPGFASPGNALSLTTSLLPLLLLAVGQTWVLVSGGIDLSVTATIALTSVLGGLAVNEVSGWLGSGPFAIPGAILLMLAAGAGVGFLNGLAVAQLRMPPFMVTLTSLMFFSGVAVWLTQSQPIGSLPATFTAFGGRLGWSLPIAAVLTWIAHLGLSRTVLGRWLYAVGQNARTAEVSGVPVRTVTVCAYVVSGLLAAVASLFLTGQAETASPVLGQRMLLDVIAATVIGGVSLYGGQGRILGVLFGVLFIRLIDNSLNLLGLNFTLILMTKGAVILLAAWLDGWRRQLARMA